MSQQLYESQPLQCWQRAKEVRLNFYKEFLTANQQGRLVNVACGLVPQALLAGLGDFVHLQAEPYGASCGFDPTFSEAAMEAFEARGFARDLCSYLKNQLGSIYLNRYLFGGEFPRPSFVLSGHGCDSHAKWVQLIAEHYQVPLFVLDIGIADLDEVKTRRKVDYLTDQFFDCIEWLEGVTGRRFDDERFREAFTHTCQVGQLWAEICCLNKAVPAPLDQKSQYSFFALPLLAPHRKEMVELLRELRDEVQERVERGIAAVPNERCRLMHDGQPPWGFLKLFRFMERYGAVCLGGIYGFSLGATWDWERMEPAKTPMDLGVPLGTRKELVRAYADWYVRSYVVQNMLFSPEWKVETYLKLMREWKAEGLLVHLNRGCEGWAFGQLEMRLGLVKAGRRVVTYEGNMSDKREFDEAQTLDRIEAFLQSLGLKKID